jgi:hypothetical protein
LVNLEAGREFDKIDTWLTQLPNLPGPISFVYLGEFSIKFLSRFIFFEMGVKTPASASIDAHGPFIAKNMSVL